MPDERPPGRTAPPGASGWAAPFITGEADVELTPHRLEKRRLAAAVRRIVDAAISMDLSADEVTSLADRLDAMASELSDRPAAAYEGFAEAATSPWADGFFDRSPVLGEANALAPPIRLEFSPDRIVGRVVFGAAYEGPPSCVHGGWIAAAFDEVLGAAQSISGAGGMTAYLKVDYRAPTPLHEELVFEGELARREGRKIFTTGRVRHGDLVTAEAEALFISIDFSRFAEMRRARGDEVEGTTGDA
ncbi:PaaI family thioesterase [Actinomarinicola tropica]|uniref:Acyl-coenzyme A thioesterase THEM4 n=1 Tax=Actinomarinicola tropica TaxID=2789776 RepID=A0A5Q2RGG7_9ACTN|nr:PaaI family thioesterase [Actinomarinicola tropica]QGG94803.1 PaaI family thioesterase [Actinomarinicola tropica]